MKGLRIKAAVFTLLLLFFVLPAQAYVKCGKWSIEAEALYAQTENNFFNTFPYAEVFPTTLAEPRRTFHLNNHDWDWGYRLGLGYDFPSCTTSNYGLSLEYTRYDTHQNDNTPFFPDVRGLAAPTLVSPLGSFLWGGFNEGRAQLDTNYMTLDLLAHKNWALCYCAHLQLFAGVRYLKLEQDLHADYDYAISSPGVLAIGSNLHIHSDSDYKGIGPRIGLGADYPLYRCFSITGEVGGEWLFGTRDTRVTDDYIQTDPFDGSDLIDNHTHHDHDNHHSVPGISGKLALAYRNQLCNCGWLNLELGYRADKYFDVVHCFKYSDDHNITGCRCKERNDDNDFAFHGPYLALSFHL